ncbi:MAG: AbrB/MazE/SpoVT family DNA-binding domain-containing protein [Betaproteobacteria bacterium]
MNTSTLTIKGQVTIPKRLRDFLGLSPGDKVRFEHTEDGAVRIVAPRKSGPVKARTASRFSALRGTRKTGMSTDEIMSLLRGYGDDAGDPGFKIGKK